MTDALKPPVQVGWNLILNDGSNATRTIPVDRETLLIGRADTSDLHLDDAHVSRQHARLTRQGDQLIVEDLQTINGTLVNGQPLTHPYILQPGDIISLGPFTLSAEKVLIPVRVSSAPPPAPALPRPGLLAAGGVAALIFITLAGLGLYWLVGRSSQPPATVTEVALKGPVITIRQGPDDDSTLAFNRTITIQASAADPGGVTRLELWANGRKIDEVDTQLVQVGPTLNAGLRWTPDTPGPYALEVRAYNTAGLVNLQLVARVRVAAEPSQPLVAPAPAPSATPAPLAPTAAAPAGSPTPTLIPDLPTSAFKPTPTLLPEIPTSVVPVTPTPSQAILTLTAPVLNVRAGPGSQYGWLGQLNLGSKAAIVGQTSTGEGKWWLIRFDAAPGRLGWVSADPDYSTASNAEDVPALVAPPLPAAAAAIPASNTALTTPAPTAAQAGSQVLRAPAGKTLLIVSNRSLANQPALLTLSGGKSVGGGKEVDSPAGQDVQLVLEPDSYRALWSSPARRGGFVKGADFTAEADKVIVMWIIPEDGVTQTEIYEQLTVSSPAAALPTPTPAPVITSTYTAPEGKVVLVAVNRTLNSSYAVLTVAGGSFGAGKEIKLDGGNEIPLELTPGKYRMVWSTPAYSGGFSAGREFEVFGGEVVYTWIVPEQGEVYIQFPGYAPEQLK